MDRENNPITRFLNRLGPGLITGASDDDPSGIGTYSQAGASLGFATLWTAIVTLPLMIVVQHICAKIGMCSGRGLAGVLHRYYSKKLLYPVVIGLVIANTINAGALHGLTPGSILAVMPPPGQGNKVLGHLRLKEVALPTIISQFLQRTLKLVFGWRATAC